jgi:DNA processing protein
MSYEIKKLDEIPEKLKEIHDAPKTLFYQGEFPKNPELKFLAVVGSRKYTNYGKDACEAIIAGLAGYPIVIVSGLALGIDTIAHATALRLKMKTLSIPGSGLSENVIYPRSNLALRNAILKSGGCMLSEFEEDFKATNWSFPRRNRIMAGLCDAVVIIEAEEKSGSLITARLGLEYNRDVLVLPGSIFSPTSTGTNNLLKDGAHPCLGSKEVLELLGFKEQVNNQKTYDDCTPDEKAILELLYEPMPKEMLMQKYPGSVTDLNMYLSILEIKGHIKETMGEIRKV